MSTQTHAPGVPYQRPDESSMSATDWAEDVAVGVLLFAAFAVVAAIVALLIIV